MRGQGQSGGQLTDVGGGHGLDGDGAVLTDARPRPCLRQCLDEALRGLIGAAPLVVAGDAAQRAADILSPRSCTIVIEGSAPDAAGVLQAVLRRARAGESRVKPLPLYLRPPDVTISTAHQVAGW